MTTTLIKNGTILTATERRAADVLIENGIITRVEPGITAPADTTVDAAGHLVLPGGIDAHTHLDMPFGRTTNADDFETGTIAAAFGGTTTIIDFATPEPGESLHAALATWHAKAEGRAVIDYGFHMVVRHVDGDTPSEMEALARREGVTSFKLFLAYPGRLMVDDGTLFRALRQTREHGGLVCVHAENGSVIDTLVREALARGETAPKYHALTRPTKAEGEATARAIALGELADAPILIVHVSCAEALAAIAEARLRDVTAFGETCPQYLFLSDEEYARDGFEGAKFVMSPPLREQRHQDALWRGLRDNDLQLVSTDHCPFNMNRADHKPLGRDDFSKIPNGAPGIETRLMLLWQAVRDGRLDEHRFVEVTASNPAKLFGLWPRKGTIAPGSDGDVVVWDPARSVTLSAASLHMRVDYNPFEGMSITGAPATVISRGKVVVANSAFVGRPGSGRYLLRQSGDLLPR